MARCVTDTAEAWMVTLHAPVSWFDAEVIDT